LFQQSREASAEPCRDFVARARSDIADGFQSGTAQAAGDGILGAEREYRQWPDRIGFFALPDDLPGAIARHRAGTDRCTCNPGADRKTLPRQRFADDLHQRSLAAEQMGAASDIEKQAMRRIERY
jgi:hypothetical protein